MPDIYDQLLDAQATSPISVDPAPPAPKQDAYDTLLDQQQAQDARATGAQLEQATKVKPDHAVQVRDLAKSSGLPVDLVERNFEKVQQRDKAMKMRSVLASSPVLAKQMRAPEFAGVAHGDTETLAAIERAIRTHGELKAPTGPEGSFSSIAGGLGTAVANWFPAIREGLRFGFADTFGLEDMQRDAMRRAANVQMSNTLATPDFQSSTAQGLYGGAVSVIHMVPSIAAGIATRSPGVALGIMGAQTQTQAYSKYRLRGGTPGEAALGSTLEGGIEVATEMLPMSFLVKNLGKVGLGQFVSGFIGREALTEQVATLTQDAVDTAIANPDKTWGQYAAERPDAAYQTFLGTLVASGVFGGMNSVARRMAGREEDVRISEDGARLIESLNKLAAASELQKIDAGSFEAFVEQAAQEGTLQDVYIDANALMQSGLAEQVAAVSPSVADQLEVAVQTGGAIKIPVAEYAAAIAPTDFAQGLLDHLKVDPDGFSRAEAQAYMQSAAQQLEQEIEQAVAGQQADDTVRASVEVVRDNIKAQLDTANRFTPQVNDAYASMVGEFYATQAARLGITPEAMFQRYPLQVVAQSVAGGQKFDQTVDTPAFREWFGDSKVVDDAGVPQVVYHGTSQEFTEFDPTGGNTPGSWFTTDASAAQSFGNPMSVYLLVSRPGSLGDLATARRIAAQTFDPMDQGREFNEAVVQQLEASGFDGIHAENFQGSGGREVWMALRPEQIKSATGNRGTFDANDPNILHQSQDEPRNLFVAHNLSAENILAAQDLGGLAAPSIAIGRSDIGFDSFGEVTLLADPSLLEDRTIRTFDADIYSPRQPRAHYDLDLKAYHAFEQSLDPDRLGLSKPDSNEVSGTTGADALLRSDAVRLKFLQEQGQAPRLHNAKAEPAVRRAAKLDGNRWELAQDPKFIRIATDYYRAQVDRARAADDTRGDRYEGFFFEADGTIMDDSVRKFADMVQRFKDTKGKDVNRLRDDLRDKFTQKKRADEYAQWVTDQFNKMVKGKTLFKGFTDAGNRRYAPYTMDNVVREMTQQLQAGEGSFYGAGTVRSAYANEMRTLDQIRQRRGQIVSEAEFKTLRDESNQVLQDALEKLKPHYKFDADSWNYSEDAGSAIAEGPKGLREAFDVTPEVQQIVADLVEYLQAMPTTYFEAKARRAMQFGEFDTAVVPKGMRRDALQVLRDAGLKIKTYDPKVEGSRNQVVAGQERLLFQNQRAPRGFFSPETGTIGLLKAADLSTFLHESGHFFLEVQLDMAVKLASGPTLSEGEQQIVADANALLQWFGVTDLATWYGLDFEEKRSYHEQFARGFEAYLFEGTAPSIEIQGIFQRFRSWLVNVYKKLKALNVELTDEVRSVMDRMLATDDQIKAAEYGRSMMPLFESAQQAGMTPEDFAAYQALGQDATADAQTQLSERGLRDLKWLSNAKSRALKRLQKEAEDLRTQERIDVRREIMSQPVYRAWQFLTGKISADDRIQPTTPRPKSDPDVVDPSQDSLFVAIAKLGGLQRDAAQSEWGIDPKEKIVPPVFGKPVLRKTDGLTVEQMREALGEHGYLDNNHENPNWDPNEFEWKFFDELGGSSMYSNQYDYDAAHYEDIAGQGVNLESVMAGRLSRPELRDMYGNADDAAWKGLEARRMVVNNGLHPDLVAELFGFTSGDELVQSLARAQPPDVEIEALTDLRMLERHGDLATPEALARAADAAIHNDLRARVIATEHKALNDAIGPRAVTGTDRNGRKITTALLPQAAREFAKTMVSRLKVRNIRPGQYAAAESRAAKAADKALRAGNLEQAAAEKRNQLVNTYATKAAHDAIDEVEKGVRYLKTFNNDGTRKNLDIDYLDQIDAMLARFDLRTGQSLKAIDKRTSLAEWIAARSDEGTEPDIAPWLAAEANREHYKNLTLEQFRGVVDAVKQIEHLARLKHKLLTSKDKRELDAIVDEVRTSINDNANGRVVDNERRNTLSSTVAHAMRGFMAVHRKLANLMREMDGFKDGGPLWEFIVRPMNDAGNKETSMRADAAKRLYALSKPILADGNMGGKGRFFPTVGRAFNRGERLAVALNWGNEGNRQRLLDGSGWTAAQMKPVLESLSLKDWQFVQGVWDFFESYRPEIAAKERRVSGKEPEWIEVTPITVRTADGQEVALRGGYYPVKYDPNQSGEAGAHDEAERAKAMMRAAYTAATTRRSFTKSRAEAVKGRPLLLSFDGIYRGANEVIHDLSWHEWLIDANRLLRRLDGPMRTGYGAQTVSAIKAAIKDVAVGDQGATHAVERSLNHLRTGATVTGLAWNLTTALLQPIGITQSIVRVGPAWIARGLREFYGSPTRMLAKAEEVNAQSEFMRNRARTMNREINDVRNQLTEGKGQMRTMVETSFFVLIQKLQMTVDYPTWLGAYEKAIADPGNALASGMVDEARAVRLADQAVIDAQGDGSAKDLSQVQRGHPAFKLFTNFYSFFNVALNLAVDRTKGTNFKDPVEVARLAGDYVLLMVVPSILSGVLRDALTGGDDDDLLKKIAEEQIGFLMGMFVGVRELTSAAQFALGVGNPAFGYAGPAGTRFFSEMTRLSQQIGQGEVDKALLKSANNVGGVLFHYPSGAVNRAVEGAIALMEGRTKNPLALLVGPPRN